MSATATPSLLKVKLIMLLLLANQYVNCATILLVPFPFPSHVMMMFSIGEELVDRGHQVYVTIESKHSIQDVISKKGVKILNYFAPVDAISFGNDEFERRVFSHIFDGGTAELASSGNLRMLGEMSEVGYSDCEYMMSDHTFLDQARQLEFDIAIVEPYFVCPCKMILARYLEVPFISYTGALIPLKFGLPALPSYAVLPVPFGFPVPSVDSFIDRIRNLQVWIAAKLLYDSYEKNVSLLQQFSPDVETWNDLIGESQLVLIDYDHIVHEPLPLLPHVVDVAGCTVKPAKPLPPNLERVFQTSDNGVILVSFGSLMSHLPMAVQTAIMDGFSRLNRTVVMKLSAYTNFTHVPPNVHLFSWLPQNDILADNRTRLFMTHCGINGVQEGIFHAVPILGLPIFDEQSYNCYRVQTRGVGTCLDIWNLSAAQIADKVGEMLINDSYRRTVGRLSAIIRDQPLFGRRKAAYWIEHVIEFGGKHLQSPIVKMPLHQLCMFDLLAVAFPTLFFCLSCIFMCFWCLCQMHPRQFGETTENISKKTE